MTACRCWQTSPPIPHDGHCCFRDDPTPLAEIVTGTPPPCGHWVEVWHYDGDDNIVTETNCTDCFSYDSNYSG